MDLLLHFVSVARGAAGKQVGSLLYPKTVVIRTVVCGGFADGEGRCVVDPSSPKLLVRVLRYQSCMRSPGRLGVPSSQIDGTALQGRMK